MKLTLEAARINNKLTIAQASKLLGISAATLCSYEAGNTYPTVPIIYRMEAVYRAKFEDIDFSCPRPMVYT